MLETIAADLFDNPFGLPTCRREQHGHRLESDTTEVAAKSTESTDEMVVLGKLEQH